MAQSTPVPLTRDMTDATTTAVIGTLWKEQRQFYINPFQYSELWQAATPFISAMVDKARVITGLADPRFKMFQHEEPWVKQEAVVAGCTATVPNDDTGIADLTLTSVTGLASITSDSLKNMTFEVWDATKTTLRGQILITVNSSGTYTCKSLKASTITGMIATDILVANGTGYGEGAEAGDAWADELKLVYGSTGIHRTPVEVTGTLYQASLRGANKELARLRMQKLQNHKILENKRLLRSVNMTGTNHDEAATWNDAGRTGATNGSAAAGGKVRTPYGILSAILDYGTSTETSDSQNIFNRAGGVKWNQFVDDMEKCSQYVNYDGTRDWFCGPRAFSFWSKTDSNDQGDARNRLGLRVSGIQNSNGGYGYNFKWLETPFGLQRLILDPSQRFEYSNYMWSPSWNNVYYAIYRPFVWDTAIKDKKFNGYDGIKDEYFNDTGVGTTLIKSHALYILPKS
jgi:hypothetical protein